MKCPSCKTEIQALKKECPACGVSYGANLYARFSLYFDLKKKYENLVKIKAELSDEVENTRRQFLFYEGILTEELKTIKLPIKPQASEKEETQPTPKGSQGQPPPQSQVQQTEKPPGQKPLSKPKLQPAPPQLGSLELRIGQRLLLIVGVIFTIIGVAYFLKYSFDKGWVGPAGRVALAYLWGIAFLILGQWFKNKDYTVFGLYIFGGGLAVLYFSTFAAFHIYHLFSQFTSFFLMILTTVLACSMAVVYNTKWIAVLGIIGGFTTPLLLKTGIDNQLSLMSYMSLLNIGIFAISFYKRWNLLNYLGFFFTYFLYTIWFIFNYSSTKFWPSILFLTFFYLIYSVVPFAYQFLKAQKESLKGFIIITPNSLIAFSYSYFMVADFKSVEWVSVISLFYAFSFLSMAYFLYLRQKQDTEAYAVLIGKAALFLVITIPVLFSDEWVTIFWIAQAAALIWLGTKLNKGWMVVSAYILLFISIFKFIIYDYPSLFKLDYDNFIISKTAGFDLGIARMITSMSVLIGMYIVSRLLNKSKRFIALTRFSYTVFGALFFLVLNVEVSNYFYHNLSEARFAAISILWGLFSITLMIIGIAFKVSPVRKVSFALFFVTILKVFLVDMGKFSTPYRILSFIILGLLLVITSYLYHKHKDRILGLFNEK
ncbi:MAG: DUF2339 domain-containing protein [Candidatus Magnetoovum sp. WYHC-5]|nr:DUF2339 domain-containing protein [Candidatus Magnetoovum sp. WYHC-5]